MNNDILLTIGIPSYNAARFLDTAIAPLIKFENDIEIIIINDGSKDNTLEVANQWKNRHPNLIKIVDKENGGHGSGINYSAKLATGLYFKVLDADDQLDVDGLEELLNSIKTLRKEDKELPDVFLADYVSKYINGQPDYITSVRNHFKVGETISIEQMKKFGLTEYLMMHLFFTKTSLVKQDNFHMAEKCFYEDNQFVFYVTKYAKTYYYLNKPIYLYRVGDVNQSTSVENMKKHYNDALRVYEAIFELATADEYTKLSKKHKYHLLHWHMVVYTLTYVYAHISGDKEPRNAFKELNKKLKSEDPRLYKMVHSHPAIFAMTNLLPTCLRRPIIVKSRERYAKKKGWTI